MFPPGMPKWTEQEQKVIGVLLVLFFVGIAGKAWLKSHSMSVSPVGASVSIQSAPGAESEP
jgi:hypothetical protein